MKLLVYAVAVAVLMLLWNRVMPGLFPGTGRLDYWHALGLLLICRILFGRGHGRHSHRHEHRKHWGNLTPEEREQLKARLQNH
ncbi:MAG TPA: hypothetical protein VMH83_07335 [Candidatus Acidoferrum sp.]|nr:hypothetical protein [Candidatus Acidoferrum sp.]